MGEKSSSGLIVRTVVGGVLALGLVASVAAQAAPAKPTTPARDPLRGFGVNMAGGVLWGGGANYKVRFGDAQVEFTPALGRAADHNLPVTFSTLSIGRGGDSAPVASGAPRIVGAASVEYERGTGVIERHEMRADGMELSFVFAAPPTGAGDLVVRLALQSELPAQAAGQHLHFVQPGVGGTGIGTVTGIDASGATAGGALHYADGVLELSLPEAFVNSAAWPMVLDPFIYPVAFVAPDPFANEGDPDVAYDGSFDRYLVVWDKIYSSTDIDIRGQYLDGVGNIDPFGYWFIETATNTVSTAPAVGSLSGHSRFMVVWEQRPSSLGLSDLYGCSLSTAGFGQSATIPIITGGGVSHIRPDVGGHSKSESNVVNVVWEESDQILHRWVGVPFPDDPFLFFGIQLVGSSPAIDPAITKSGGDSFQHLVVYRKFFTFPTADHDLYASLIDVSGNILWNGPIATTIGPDERAPDVDGDGAVFFVAFSRAPSLFDFSTSVHATRTVLGPGGTSFVMTEVVIDNSLPLGLDAQMPAVAFTGNGALIAWSKQYGGTDYDIPLVALDPWSSTLADQLAYADFEGTYAFNPMVCAKYSAKHFLGDGAMVTWETTDDVFDHDVRAAAVDPELGVVTDLGGATPLGGKASVSAATVGNTGFTHFYDGVYAFNSVTLVLSLNALMVPYCTGTLVPSPDLYFGLVTGGDTKLILPTPMPGDPVLLGITLYEQYSEKDLISSPCNKKIQLSNGLSILIE